jgi:hypothetical protein
MNRSFKNSQEKKYAKKNRALSFFGYFERELDFSKILSTNFINFIFLQ